jgi:hemerythrin-like domain-containing protein
MTMPALLEILEQEHADMRRLLDLIKTQADTAEVPDFGLLHEILEYCLAYSDQYHHPKEELMRPCANTIRRAPEPSVISWPSTES